AVEKATTLLMPLPPLSMMVMFSLGVDRVVGAQMSIALPITAKLAAGRQRSSSASTRGRKRPFWPGSCLVCWPVMELLNEVVRTRRRPDGDGVCVVRRDVRLEQASQWPGWECAVPSVPPRPFRDRLPGTARNETRRRAVYTKKVATRG